MADRFLGKHTIFDDAGNSRTPYMTRMWIGRLRLHIFYRGDNDPDPHDHPWDFWTFPLTSYVEEVTNPHVTGDDRGNPYVYRRVVERFQLHYRRATHCHRVLGRWSGALTPVPMSSDFKPAPTHTDGKIITLVWRGKSERPWGFLRDRDGKWCWTPWKEYVFGGGKHAPCEPAAPPSPQSNLRGSALRAHYERELTRILAEWEERRDVLLSDEEAKGRFLILRSFELAVEGRE